MKRLLRKHDLEFTFLGFEFNLKRLVGLSVLVVLLVLFAYSLTQMGGGGSDTPETANETVEYDNVTIEYERYAEDETNWPLCMVFIFLAVVLPPALFTVGVRNILAYRRHRHTGRDLPPADVHANRC